MHLGEEGVRYPCVLFQTGTHYRASTTAKPDGPRKVRPLSRLTVSFSLSQYKQMLVKAFTEQVVPHFSTESTHRLRPVVDRVYPVADIQEAHKYMESNQNVGKIVLELPQ